MAVGRSKQQGTSPGGIKADLHMHTIHSDGASTPLELVEKARVAGLDIISITDHDSIGGFAEAAAAAVPHGIEVIPGIEFSAMLNGREIHIIGYFVDPASEALTAALIRFRTDRLRRAEEIVGRLNELNIPVKMEEVLRFAGGGAVGRPHIARALLDGGHVESYYQAFTRFISDYGPAYVRKSDVPVEEVLSLISMARGLSVLAHPGKTITEPELLALISAGIDGIEVQHPSHGPELVKYYRGIVNQYYLVETAGSDFHGGPKGDDRNFGQYTLSGEGIEAMRRRLPVT